MQVVWLQVQQTIGAKFNVSLNIDEIGIVVQSSGQVLPCGVVCIAKNNI